MPGTPTAECKFETKTTRALAGTWESGSMRLRAVMMISGSAGCIVAGMGLEGRVAATGVASMRYARDPTEMAR